MTDVQAEKSLQVLPIIRPCPFKADGSKPATFHRGPKSTGQVAEPRHSHRATLTRWKRTGAAPIAATCAPAEQKMVRAIHPVCRQMQVLSALTRRLTGARGPMLRQSRPYHPQADHWHC